jgi:hypothetical protein
MPPAAVPSSTHALLAPPAPGKCWPLWGGAPQPRARWWAGAWRRWLPLAAGAAAGLPPAPRAPGLWAASLARPLPCREAVRRRLVVIHAPPPPCRSSTARCGRTTALRTSSGCTRAGAACTAGSATAGVCVPGQRTPACPCVPSSHPLADCPCPHPALAGRASSRTLCATTWCRTCPSTRAWRRTAPRWRSAACRCTPRWSARTTSCAQPGYRWARRQRGAAQPALGV